MKFDKKMAMAPLAMAGALTGATSCKDAGKAPERPNVIFILADDMGYSGVQCYGGDGIPSPAVDWLAQNGIVCTDYHVNAPVSSPTRVSIMTGRYQQRAGLNHIYSEVDSLDGLDPEVNPTLVGLFREAGYRTAIEGKWHLGQDVRFNPLNHGFDEWHGYTMGNIDFISHYNTRHKIDWWDGREVKDEPGYVTHLINKYSVDFIRRSARAGEPFFLFVSHDAVHVPIQGPNDPPLRTAEVCPYRNDTEMADTTYRRAYRQMVEAVDQGVQQMIDALKEEGVLDNTLIVFTSDNGGEEVAAEKYPGNNGWLRGSKGQLYEGGTRVPAIFWFPREWGHRYTIEPMMSMDMLPTILDLCGISLDREVDGISCLDMLRDGTPLPQRKVFWGNTGSLAARDGWWKFVWTRDMRTQEDVMELFNLLTDRNEGHDLSAMYPERTQRMRQETEQWWAEVTAGTALEGKTSFNSGWIIDYIRQLRESGGLAYWGNEKPSQSFDL